ncbi:hypothetical protein PoB_003969400 [Plakobranchus ocellatus]|uniref:Uncharacterized protein n=1 Tax=Plakobranchus ocellatus TaxID=259542 RepID=A0AAV4AZK9_9GAST|nr:hypothetical protein PoB_003969400 [Plakobranchus ocellatus]
MWHRLCRTIQATSYSRTMPQPIVPGKLKLTSQDNRSVSSTLASSITRHEPIEHVWDILGRHIHGMNPAPQNNAQLAQSLTNAWTPSHKVKFSTSSII